MLTTVKFTENQQVFQELLWIEQLTNNVHCGRTEQIVVKTCRVMVQLNIFVIHLFCNFLLKQKKDNLLHTLVLVEFLSAI